MEDQFYANIFKAFLLVAVILFITSYATSGASRFNANIVAYFILTISFLMMSIMVMNIFFKYHVLNNLSAFLQLFSMLAPIILLVFSVGYMLYLMINNKNKILRNRVSSSYYTFSNIGLILLGLQTYILYQNTDTSAFKISGKIPGVALGFIYLLAVFSIVCIINMHIILKYFTTDGFEVRNGNTNYRNIVQNILHFQARPKQSHEIIF